jgi:predicted permease
MRAFRNLFRRRHLEDSLDAELRAYVEDLTHRNVARGVAPDEARRLALAEVGGMEQIKEEVRAEWPGNALATALQDVRYACRTLGRSPGFTLVVAATLALGIGASLTMFSLMRAVLWRPLPYPEPDRIVTIQVDARNVRNAGASEGEVQDLKTRSRSLELVSKIDAVDANIEYAGEYAGETEHVAAASVSDDFLPLLGARAALGRTINSQLDEGKDQELAMVISDGLWRRRFSADPGIIGRTALVNNMELRIVGVLAPGFRLFLPVQAREQIDIWFPSRMSAARQYRGIPVVGRLRAGFTISQANAELRSLAAQFAQEHPDSYHFSSDPASLRKGSGNVSFTAHSLHGELTREARPALFLLAGAVGFVLLIACVNVANLMLARGAARQREFAIRRALGAGRARVIRQLLTESLVLAVASAAVGLLGARFGLEAISRLSSSHIPLQSRIGLDGSVMAFALVLSVVTCALFGMLPAWRLTGGKTGGNTSDALRAGRTETAGAGSRRLQRTLVIAEVALSIVPLACGGLMLRSFLNLTHSPLGFHSENVVTAKVPTSFRRFPKTEQRWAWLRDVMDRVRALPGVEAVSAASPLPLAPEQEPRRVGRADRPDALPILATQQIAAPGYLSVMGTRLLQGRDFTNEDIVGASVVIIDERLAKRLWPEGAIGKRLAIWRSAWRQDLEVVGVTAAVRATRVRDDDTPHFVMPYNLYPVDMSLVVKTRESAERIGPGIRRAVDEAHGGRAAYDIRPMEDYVADSIGDTRFILAVLAVFAGASVLLAAVGLYGTLAYLTSQRTREFGIRLALGADGGVILGIVMREGVLLAVAGAALGLAGAGAVTGAIRELLYGVRPLDGVTLAGVAGLVAIVALGAAGIPAWRATRIDPQVSLRSE